MHVYAYISMLYVLSAYAIYQLTMLCLKHSLVVVREFSVEL